MTVAAGAARVAGGTGRADRGRLLLVAAAVAFSSAGFGYGYSHGHALRFGFSFLRIDHMLVSKEIGVADAFPGGWQASEHRPVIADLLLRRSK